MKLFTTQTKILIGDTPDIQQLTQLAEQNDAQSQCMLGICYLDGIALKRDYDLALKYFMMSASQDYPDAFYYIAYMCEHGLTVIKSDHVLYVKYVQKGAALNQLHCKYELGCLYADSDGLLDEDKDMAERLLNYVGDNGCLEGYHTLGECYQFPLGCFSKDLKKAIAWHQKAADLGLPSAQVSFASMMMDGLGTKRNRQVAFTYYQKAAEQDYVYGIYNVGACYFLGWGVEKDYEQAYYWIDKAANVHNYDIAKGILPRVRNKAQKVWREKGLCQHCGGELEKDECVLCKKHKDYK